MSEQSRSRWLVVYLALAMMVVAVVAFAPLAIRAAFAGRRRTPGG